MAERLIARLRNIATALTRILPALRTWLVLTVMFLGCMAVGGLPTVGDRYWLFTIVCWAVLDISWALASRNTTPTAAGERDRGGLLPVTLLPYALYCLPLSSFPVLGHEVLPRIVAVEALGAVLCAFGVASAIWARHVLADNWSGAVALKAGQALVQRGPYAIVRHPIYSGLLAAMVGMILVLGEVRALVFVLGMGLLLKKMHHEEGLLRAAFPDEYPEYQRRVKRLVPWIW